MTRFGGWHHFSLFDQLVNEALRARADLTSLRPVVETELLHHDILREMGAAVAALPGPASRPPQGPPRSRTRR